MIKFDNLERQIKELKQNCFGALEYGNLNDFLLTYYKAIQKVSKTDDFFNCILESNLIDKKYDMMFELYIDWYEKTGALIIDKILRYLDVVKLDDRFNSFINVYQSYLEDAIRDSNIEVLFEFLYRIPPKMEKDFERFGFLCADEFFITATSIFEEIKPIYFGNQFLKLSINLMEPDNCRASIILC